VTDPQTDPTQPPDYIIRTYNNGSRSNPVIGQQMTTLSAEDMATFTAWNQNVATQSGVGDGTIPVAGTITSGTVNGQTVGVGPSTSVDLSKANMMVSQDFTNPNTVANQKHWSWDGTDGDLALGCARVECDGAQDDLVSNEIHVLTGEKIEVSCEVKWENIVYTGSNPIVLGVEKYRQGKDPTTGGITYLDLGGVDVAAIESPAGFGEWGQGALAGFYIVEAGVDQLRFRFRAAQTITQGVIKWDEAVFLKPDLIADSAVPGVGMTVDDIVTNLYGAAGAGFSHNDAAVALANTSSTIQSINARLSQSEAANSPGNIAGDDFTESGELIASGNWIGGYRHSPIAASGMYVANGADAAWVGPDGTSFYLDQECWFAWQGTGQFSSTDYQISRLLMSSAPTTDRNGFLSYIHVLGRVATDFSSYVRARFSSDGKYVVAYTTDHGATFTKLKNGTCTVPGSGALISLYCGNQASSAPRHFKLTINDATVADFDESGSGSPIGPDNRRWGWGAETEGGFFFLDLSQADAANVGQWLGYDQ
jgi:hypothetical protein